MVLTNKAVKGILIDLDGVLYVGGQPIEGAIEALNAIKSAGFQCRFVTNTSTLSVISIQQKLHRLGFEVALDEIMSAPQAAVNYLNQQNNPVCMLLLADDVKQDFSAFVQSDTEANVIVVGDIGDAWTYALLNQVFDRLMDGATLLAMHKSRFWQTEKGLQMDIGAFIAGLEYASQTESLIIGKPSQAFFQAALDSLQLKAGEVIMVGDDIDSDIGGAQEAGMTGVLVRTGKYRADYVSKSQVQPETVIDSIVALPEWLGIGH